MDSVFKYMGRSIPWEEKETCDTSDDKNLIYVIPFPQATAVPYMVSIL